MAVAGDWLEAQKLDIRVGKVISAELHPDADRQGRHTAELQKPIEMALDSILVPAVCM